jgi:hypothetical protein
VVSEHFAIFCRRYLLFVIPQRSEGIRFLLLPWSLPLLLPVLFPPAITDRVPHPSQFHREGWEIRRLLAQQPSLPLPVPLFVIPKQKIQGIRFLLLLFTLVFAAVVSFVFVVVSEIGLGFSPDIKRRHKSGFSPGDMPSSPGHRNPHDLFFAIFPAKPPVKSHRPPKNQLNPTSTDT